MPTRRHRILAGCDHQVEQARVDARMADADELCPAAALPASSARPARCAGRWRSPGPARAGQVAPAASAPASSPRAPSVAEPDAQLPIAGCRRACASRTAGRAPRRAPAPGYCRRCGGRAAPRSARSLIGPGPAYVPGAGTDASTTTMMTWPMTKAARRAGHVEPPAQRRDDGEIHQRRRQPRLQRRVGTVERVEHRGQREAEHRQQRDPDHDQQDRVGGRNSGPEQAPHQRPAGEHQERDGERGRSRCQGSAAQHQPPRMLGREVHPHDFGIIGLGEEIGRLLRAVGEARPRPGKGRRSPARATRRRSAGRSVPRRSPAKRSG